LYLQAFTTFWLVPIASAYSFCFTFACIYKHLQRFGLQHLADRVWRVSFLNIWGRRWYHLILSNLQFIYAAGAFPPFRMNYISCLFNTQQNYVAGAPPLFHFF
jgi:hypothetical protein